MKKFIFLCNRVAYFAKIFGEKDVLRLYPHSVFRSYLNLFFCRFESRPFLWCRVRTCIFLEGQNIWYSKPGSTTLIQRQTVECWCWSARCAASGRRSTQYSGPRREPPTYSKVLLLESAILLGCTLKEWWKNQVTLLLISGPTFSQK